MPLTYVRTKTPAGFDLLRSEATGELTRADAEDLLKRLAAGGEYHRVPVLYVTDATLSLTGEARRALSTGEGEQTHIPSAIVLTSAVLRVTVGFLLRVSPNKPPVRLFASEAEALAWLDEVIAKLPPDALRR